MAILLSRRTGSLAAAALLTVVLAVPANAVPDEPRGCFEVRVDYLGRVPVSNVNGVQLYRWNYRVTGMGCISRKLGHWTLGLCAQTLQSLSQVSLLSGDNSDPVGGAMTTYKTKVGKDISTNLSGLEWAYQSGNAVDKLGECDDFSFVASGAVTPIAWGAKAGTFVVTGTTFGPACAPVPVEATSWGAVKALFRS